MKRLVDIQYSSLQKRKMGKSKYYATDIQYFENILSITNGLQHSESKIV